MSPECTTDATVGGGESACTNSQELFGTRKFCLRWRPKSLRQSCCRCSRPEHSGKKVCFPPCQRTNGARRAGLTRDNRFRLSRNLNEPDMQKHTVEIRIGRDEDDRWWVVVIVDANDNDAVWRGPIRRSAGRRERGTRARRRD